MRNVMKTFIAVIALPAAVLVSAPVLAQTKIATVRANALVAQSPQYKALETKMKADFERRANELQAEGKQLEADLKKFQQEADLLSPQDRNAREKDLNTRQIDFGYKRKQFQEDVQNRERELSGQMMEEIKGVIAAVAKEKGVDAVLQDPVYAADGIDITDDVLQRLTK